MRAGRDECPHGSLRRQCGVCDETDERDHWIRLFNRLEGAVAHHRKTAKFAEIHDEALYAAHDRVLRDAGRSLGTDTA